MRSLIFLALALGVLPSFAAAHDEAPENAVLSPDGRIRLSAAASSFAWPEHPYQRAVCFDATNVDDETVWFPGIPPFSWVTGPGGAEYGHHGALTAHMPLEPGETYTRCWGKRAADQGGSPGAYAACTVPGPYTFSLEHPDEVVGHTVLTLPFSLRGPLTAPEPLACPVGDLL